jgi:hypothetical protein
MTAPEQEIAKKIINKLDLGSRDLDPATVLRLATARDLALDRYKHLPSENLVTASGLFTQDSGRSGNGLRYIMPLMVLLLGLAGIVYWQGSNGADGEVADIDARLLTDDLPIDAYLDKGFDSWLKRQSH